MSESIEKIDAVAKKAGMTEAYDTRSKISNKWLNGPRINALLGLFSKMASGEKGKPQHGNVEIDEHLLIHHDELMEYYQIHKKFTGIFAQHYYASVPYSLEEDCRLGYSLLKYLEELSLQKNRVAAFLTA